MVEPGPVHRRIRQTQGRRLTRIVTGAVDPASGRETRRVGGSRASVARHGSRLLVQSQAGGWVGLLDRVGADLDELGRLPVFTPGAVSETPPTILDGIAYVRNGEEMVAIDPGGDGG